MTPVVSTDQRIPKMCAIFVRLLLCTEFEDSFGILWIFTIFLAVVIAFPCVSMSKHWNTFEKNIQNDSFFEMLLDLIFVHKTELKFSIFQPTFVPTFVGNVVFLCFVSYNLTRNSQGTRSANTQFFQTPNHGCGWNFVVQAPPVKRIEESGQVRFASAAFSLRVGRI